MLQVDRKYGNKRLRSKKKRRKKNSYCKNGTFNPLKYQCTPPIETVSHSIAVNVSFWFYLSGSDNQTPAANKECLFNTIIHIWNCQHLDTSSSVAWETNINSNAMAYKNQDIAKVSSQAFLPSTEIKIPKQDSSTHIYC